MSSPRLAVLERHLGPAAPGEPAAAAMAPAAAPAPALEYSVLLPERLDGSPWAVHR
jgi:hypothetical protein